MISKSSETKDETYLHVYDMQICIYERAFQKQSNHALSHGDKHLLNVLNELSMRPKDHQNVAES